MKTRISEKELNRSHIVRTTINQYKEAIEPDERFRPLSANRQDYSRSKIIEPLKR